MKLHKGRSRLRTRLRILRFAVALLATASGCGGPETIEAPRNVILLTVDTLRADSVSFAGYPHDTTPELDRIAAESTVFSTAISSHLGTPPSMSSLMTGRFPSFEGVPAWTRATHHGFSDLNAPDEKDGLTRNVVTLAEILAEAGFRTVGFNTNPHLGTRWGFNQGFDEFEDFWYWLGPMRKERTHPLIGSHPPASVVVDRVLEWLDEADDQPFFLWIHLMDSHSPYLPPEPLNRFFLREYTAAGDLEINEVLYRLLIEQYPDTPPVEYASLESLGIDKKGFIEHARGLYDAEIRIADREIGRLVGALKAHSLWDETALVMTSDHGEEFLDHGHVSHHLLEPGLEELIRIPMLVRSPTGRGAGRVVPEVVRLVDVAPTVLDLLGLTERTAQMDGMSLVPLIQGRQSPERTAFISGVDFGVARQARWKYRLERAHPGAPDALHERLFDIAADPLEEHDVAAQYPNTLDSLSELYAVFARNLAQRSTVVHDLEGETPELDPELRERLEALGYYGD